MLFSKDKNEKMEEIQEFIPVSSSAGFNNFAPHIKNAGRDYLVPVIGKAMYEELVEFSETTFPANPSDVQLDMQELLKIAQSAVIHLACWIGFDLLNAFVSGSGFKRQDTTTIKSLFKYQEDALKQYFRTTGFNGIDSVLSFLEEHISSFQEFKMAPEYAKLKSSFIPDTDTFNSIIYINRSRLTFIRMQQHMKLVEEQEIATVLGAAAYAYVKAEMIKDDPAVKVKKLLTYVQNPVAYLASALLMEESGADLTDNGLYFYSSMAISGIDTQRQPANDGRVAALVKRNRDIGNAYLDQLRSYLVANAADWKEVPVSTGKVFRRDNTGKRSFWA
jgi:hypothetical protein